MFTFITNYKLVIFGIVTIILFMYITNLKGQMSELKIEISERQIEIEKHLSLITELETRNNLLVTDQENKKKSLDALEIQLIEIQSNCENKLMQLESLHNIVIETGEEKTANEIIDKGTLVNEKDSDKFIQLRNSIYSNYK